MSNPFEFVNDIQGKKTNLIKSSEDPVEKEKEYIPFLTNLALSTYPDSVMYANEMNLYPHIDKKLQFDYYLNTIRSMKRKPNWNKKTDDGNIESVKLYFKCNPVKAKQYIALLTPEQITKIRTSQGGVIK